MTYHNSIQLNKRIIHNEKTIKSLISQPFMVVSQKGFLSKLHDEGFETYSEIFDESYDDIDNPIDRINFIIDEIKRLCNIPLDELTDMFEKVRWKVGHNYDVLKSFKQSKKIKKNYGYQRKNVLSVQFINLWRKKWIQE